MTSPDPAARLARARLSLDGLSVGDAFGERFFAHPQSVEYLIEHRAVPASPWPYTDDTAMALAICDVLAAHGEIDQDALAREFVRRYADGPDRGYGGGAITILTSIADGVDWRIAASRVFHGQGSMGNGGAMRAAPVGAYFADDFAKAAHEAKLSAEVTHMHVDAQAGAIAVAVAAAYAWCTAHGQSRIAGRSLFDVVLDHVPEGPTRAGIVRARDLPPSTTVLEAAATLGTGAQVCAWDTVPFCLFTAARYLTSYEEALWATLSGLGDRDTTCAIVGGIVVLATGAASIPAAFLEAREPLTPLA